jgi:hypothetical protein
VCTGSKKDEITFLLLKKNFTMHWADLKENDGKVGNHQSQHLMKFMGIAFSPGTMIRTSPPF